MAHNGWEADKMLDVYILDYLVKRNLQTTAEAFMAEGNVAPGPVALNVPEGFLLEWWSIFWEIFFARKYGKHSEVATAYVESQKIKSKEQQKLQLQLFIQQRQAQRINANYSSLSRPVSGMNSDRISGASAPNMLAVKLLEECCTHSNSIDSLAYTQFRDPFRMALPNSLTNHLGQVVCGNTGGSSAAAIQDIKGEGNVAVAQRLLQMDPSLFSVQGIKPSKSGIGAPGLNQGASVLPLKGLPLTHQLQYQAQAQENLNFGDIDPGKFNGLLRGISNRKDDKPTVTNGSVGSPLLASSSKVRSDQAAHFVKNSRKRKQPTSLGALNITDAGNMMCPSTSAPSTPSTHTTCGVPMGGNMQHDNCMPKGLVMYGTDAAGGPRASSDHKDLEHFEDVGSLDDHLESFRSNGVGDARVTIAAMQSSTEHNPDTSKGFTFNEVAQIITSNNIVICCHFSSDGKLLASAGHDKKVLLWNMETFQTGITPEEHTHIITDLRFRPGSMHLATSSFDRTVRLWNAADPSYCLNTFNGHSSEVMSLDFHPKKTDLLCSCDGKGEIRFWNVNQYSCSHVSKGATAQVRFQPGIGQLLAAAAENIVTLIDVETDRKTRTLQGHTKEIHCVCWDTKGELLTSVSQDCVKVWSIASGECIHELSSNGNKFHSCVFHPSYANLLVIGGYQTLELWNMVEGQRMTVKAHEELIPALAQSSISGNVASASHDKVVKLWK